ncbi:tryptophan synthase subunit alpha [Streptococcus sobrinus]|uniref:tryptophan synthase subunit alpha n=2 Tax=Streptococcus sobrinus TaxID=1310 RepID=UPI0002E7A075|nr:tryptophan synthase subunit alpha [Streptococcus sobrinus]
MTKTLSKHLQSLKDSGQGLVIPYIMAGDHELGLGGLFDTIHLLADAGASAIEIGVPFSDPVADGPVIEEAGLRSLVKGTNLEAIVEKLQSQTSPVPLVLMTYFNPVYQYGLEKLVEDLAQTSVKGLIIPDLPHEHANLILPYLENQDLCLVPLISLTTGPDRQKELLADAQGFVYAVAVNGVTGKASHYSSDLDQHLQDLRELTALPVLTGFGISSQADVERFNQVSDGVIVGSKIVKVLNQGKLDQVQDFIRQASQVRK